MLLIDGKKPQEITLPHDYPKNIVFELVESSRGRRMTANGIKQANSTHLIPLKYNLIDPKTGQAMEILFSSNGIIQRDGQGNVNPFYEPEPFSISGDVLKNKTKDAGLIYALIHSPYCENNPKYQDGFEHELKPVFRIKNLKNKSAEKTSVFARISEALGYITNQDKLDNRKVAKLYKAGGYSDAGILIENEEYDTMRAKLAEVASKDPESFFKIFEDGLADTRLTIQDALEKGVIAYSDKGFTWGATKGAHNNPTILKVAKGKSQTEAVESLIDFLRLKDDSGVFEEIKKELGGK